MSLEMDSWNIKRKLSKSSSSPSESSSSEGEDPQNGNVFRTTAAIKMFNIDLVRETILRYAIYDRKGKISPDVVKKIRLVQKSWLYTANEVLRKSEESVITLKLDETNSLVGADEVKKNGKLLDQFTATFASPDRLIYSHLPVKVILNLAFFEEENFSSLLNFFAGCGNDVKELEVIFPCDGGSMSVSLPRLTLPQLRKLTFHFSNKAYPNNPAATMFTETGDLKGLWLLQGILNGGKGLKTLIIGIPADVNCVPDGLQFLQLPPAISSLHFTVKLKSSHLQVLLLNQLPNLSELALLVDGRDPLEEGLLFKILERFRKTLKYFRVHGLNDVSGYPYEHTFLRFPLMEKLRSVEILSNQCELGPGDLSALPRCLPNLTTLVLDSTVENIETNWIANSKFNGVTELVLCCIREDLRYPHDDLVVSPSVGMLTQVNATFPLLKEFGLDVNINDMGGLTYVLQNMTHLQILHINLEGNLRDIGACSDKLDSTLLGLPLELVTALREHGELLKPVELQCDTQPSIRNLKELKTFALTTTSKGDPRMPVISDLLFRLGLMKMSKLCKLKLDPKFKLNPILEEEWKRNGRVLKYKSV